MPRSGVNGTYNVPPGTDNQQPLTVISSAMFNAFAGDVQQTFNTPQPTAYGGTNATTPIGAMDNLMTKGTDVATAATLNLDTASGQFVDLTGTTTVTAVTLSEGRHRMTRAAGNFQITVGASLIGNGGGANIAVQTGDLIFWEGYSGGVVRFWVIKASGQAVVPSAARGAISGLTLSNNATDAVNDLDVAVGEAASELSVPILMTYAGSTGRQLDVVYGSGNGARFDASISDGTWHCFVISNGVTTGFGMSKSLVPTAQANYPSGFIHYRRVGSVLRVAGSLLAFSQLGDEFLLTGSRLDVNANNPGNVATSRVLSVPLLIKVNALINYAFSNGASGVFPVLLISSLDRLDQTPSQSATPLSTAGIVGNASGAPNHTSGSTSVRTNLAGEIRTRLDQSDANVNLRIATYGWIDSRGRS